MPTTARAEPAVLAQAAFGHGPTWDAGTASLLWTDLRSRTVHRYAPDDADHCMEVPQQVAAAKPRSRGGLLLHLDDGVALYDADGERRTWLTFWARPGVRAGESTVDTCGRLWANTVREDESGDGWLVRVDAAGTAHVVLSGLRAANGLAFGPDDAQLYLVDSTTRRVEVLAVDPVSGSASGRRTAFEVDGTPAGLCTDAAGAAWIAVRDRGEVRRYAPDGRLDLAVPLPARRPTGCCFGGEDLTDLYVTTAREGLADPASEDGAVLVLPGIGTGLRSHSFAG
ncbi:SMP-30/gluconolactonase/LRE family protein [Saccharopolyspora sp. MS10]|uniref:SMP-30/gluconolactonase/LRE family protein n=1 Tax=Saccharopolyspora sp. MS10 TaxID=3385973 RepID=UPI0039A3D1E5